MGFWALWLKKALFPPLPLLYTSDGELCEEDLAGYSSLVRPYQDEPLAGEDERTRKTENEDGLDTDGLSGNPAGHIRKSRDITVSLLHVGEAATVSYLLCVSSFSSLLAIRIR